jgi:molybdopterin-guanine dinucleotide biosynthesis protein A
MQVQLQADDLRLISLLDAVRARLVEPAELDRFDPEHWSFFNVNTPADLAVVRARR